MPSPILYTTAGLALKKSPYSPCGPRSIELRKAKGAATPSCTPSPLLTPIPPHFQHIEMMLRSLPRAAPSSSSFRGPSIRTILRTPRSTLPICTADARCQQRRTVAAHAISNPTLAQIEKRWEGMPPQEQADLWMALRDRMKNDWHEMTLQERKAGMSTFRTIHEEFVLL